MCFRRALKKRSGLRVGGSQRRAAAWTLLEMIIALAVFAIAGLALITIYVFSIRSFAALTNYAMLDQQNRAAMDRLTSEIREAMQVTKYETNADANNLTIVNGQGETVTYSFSALARKMTRQVQGGADEVLLTNCDLLSFSLYLRPPTNGGTFDVYLPATNNWSSTVKLVQLSWKTSASLPNASVQSENIQTARVIIRKQQDN